MVRIALCDDDREFLVRLETILEEQARSAGFSVAIDAYGDPAAFYEDWHAGPRTYDAIFLDIEMPGQSGIELAEQIRRQDGDVLLLFVTTHEAFVYRSFEVEAFRYIPKHSLEDALPDALRAVQRKLEQRALAKPLRIKTTRGEYVHIGMAELLYVYKSGKNCVYSTREEEYAVRQPISAVAELVAEQPFVMVNSGCIVSIVHVNKVDKSDVVLSSGQRLPISRLRLKEVKMAIHLHWSNNL